VVVRSWAQAVKNCKDRECLYRVLQQRSAPAETVDFVRDMQSITSDSELGYPTALKGKGKIKAVEVFFPGLGMEGISDFVFVNGPGGMLRPKIDFDAMARDSAEYQQFKATYPQVTPWDSMAYAKEVRSADGSQTFQFTQTLLNGCHACALLGTARLGISFDATGNYIGASIIGVEPDQSAAYSSLKDELSQKSQFFSSMALTKADGTTETAQAQTIISDTVPPYSSPKQCRFSVNMNPTMTSGWFMLDHTFDIRSVIIARSTEGPDVVPQGNTLSISCADSSQCITPLYSDQRGAQQPVSSTNLLVPPDNADTVISDFEKLQEMCRRRP
jgi:hypothetical protein